MGRKKKVKSRAVFDLNFRFSDGVATIGRLLQITGLCCRIWSLLWGSFAKETYNLRSLLMVATPSHQRHGSKKVSFAKYALFCRAFWKRELFFQGAYKS